MMSKKFDKILKGAPGHSVLVVAEISANHNKDIKLASGLIKIAKKCGADAVKFQTYTPDTITLNSSGKNFMVSHPRWGGQTLHKLYGKAYTPWSWFKELKKVADDTGIIFFSTAFDKSSVDLLEELDVPCHKISSFELVDIPLIEYAAKTKKPLVLSTGMATFEEIKEAFTAARKNGSRDITLLKCVSSYPAAPEEMNLMTIPDLKKRFKCTVGLSDHTLGLGSSIAAVSLGARVIEKHITLSRKIKTPDNFFSLEPHEFKTLVDNIRVVEKALGKVHYGITPGQRATKVYRRSLFAVRDIKKGECLTEENVRSIRPSGGLEPKYLKSVLGMEARTNMKIGTPLSWNLIGRQVTE